MVVNREIFKLYETYTVKLNDSVLTKLEDSLRDGTDLLVTINASHYGFRNRNWTVYRHDTMRNDIDTFVTPYPKPIIQKHNLKESAVFGKVIAADFKLTDYYNIFDKKYDIEGLSTEEYVELMKDHILPYQRKDPRFDGLAYLELVGRLEHQEGISKVLKREFLSVSIGARPNRLVCSECLQDQISEGKCKHYGSKSNDVFMLAESLDYEELSFVNRPADPFGRVVRIHDGLIDEDNYECDDLLLDAVVDVIPTKQFFNLTDKTIVCVDNICTIINGEDSSMSKNTTAKISLSLQDEFGKDKIDTTLSKFESITLADSDLSELTDRKFAIVQKTEDGIKRRFPLTDEASVRLAGVLLCDAEDLTDLELEKAKLTISKAAEKLSLTDFEFAEKEVVEAALTDENASSEENNSLNIEKSELDTLTDAIKDVITKYQVEEETEALADGDTEVKEKSEKPSPVAIIFSILECVGRDLEWAGKALAGSIEGYFKSLGKEVVAQDSIQDQAELQKQVKDLEDEIAMLDEQNMELSYRLKGQLVDEIVSIKKALQLEDVDKSALAKVSYDALNIMVGDLRSMRVKLQDSTNNSVLNLNSIQDPTQVTASGKLADSDESDVNSDVIITDSENAPEAHVKMTKTEAEAFVKRLIKRQI